MRYFLACWMSLIAVHCFAGSIQEFSWLSGCWQNVEGDRKVEEQWMKPDGDMMLGMGRTVIGDRVHEYEFVMIQERSDGIFYVARPSGQEMAEFKLKSSESDQLVFENPQHDFPQQVAYRLAGDDSLIAWIEGMHNGTKKKIEFPYSRVSCPGGK